MDIRKSISKIIVRNISTNGWKKVDNNREEFSVELYPYANNTTIKYRYFKIVLVRLKKSKCYEFKLDVENVKYCILTNEEWDDHMYNQEDHIYFKFSLTNNKLEQCILKGLELLDSLKSCDSCNRIYKDTDLDDNNICLNCLLQNMIEKQENDCVICMDKDIPKLFYKLQCNHEFHFSCICKVTPKYCPLCRTQFFLKA
jgi:hypothetical protein